MYPSPPATILGGLGKRCAGIERGRVRQVFERSAALGVVGEAVGRFRDQRGTMAVLGIVAFLAAQLDALALVCIAGAAATIGKELDGVSVSWAGAHVDLSASQLLAIGLGAVLASAGLSLALIRGQSQVAVGIEQRLRDTLVTRFAEADWEYQSEQRRGALQGASAVAWAASRQFIALTTYFRSSVTVAVFGLTALIVDVTAAAALAVMGALLALIIVPLRRRTRQSSRQATRLAVDYGQEVSEAGELALDLRTFQAWPDMLQRLRSISATLAAERGRTSFLTGAVPTIYQAGGLAAVVLILAAINTSTASVAAWAATGLLLLRSVQYGQTVQGSLQVLAETSPALELIEVKHMAPAPAARTGSRRLERIRTVQLREVSYSYPGASAPALSGVSARLAVGEIVGVAGPSGSGKSTLGQILLRLRNPTSGSLLVDGTEADEISADSWYSHFSYVPQHPQLLRGTLMENVTYHDAAIGQQEVLRALHQAGLEDLLAEFPHGLATQLGQGIRSLSGGQVQRLGIARALARQPSVIVMDEPTSSLDHEAELVIHETLSRMRESADHLVLVIAHRTSTLALCDRVLNLSDGRLVEPSQQDPHGAPSPAT